MALIPWVFSAPPRFRMGQDKGDFSIGLQEDQHDNRMSDR